MSAPYRQALDALLEANGGDIAERDVLRIDPHRSGSLLLQVDDGQAGRWHEYSEGALGELSLAADPWLPAAELLGTMVERDGSRLLAWHPGRRATLNSEVPGGRMIIKSYRKGRSRDAATRLEIASAAAAASSLRVPAMVHFDPGLDVIEMGLIPGEPPDLYKDSGNVFFQIGHGLRQLQDAPVAGRLSVHDRSAELGVLETLSERVLRLRGVLPEGWSEAHARLRSVQPVHELAALVLTHRDLHDRQLLVHDGALGLLDFDLLCLAEPALDVANLSAHLRLRAIQGAAGATPELAEKLSVALLEGLDRSDAPGFLESLRFYQATTFLRLSLVYYLRPRWQAVVQPLVALSARCAHEMASA